MIGNIESRNANPDLVAKESDAWPLAVQEKCDDEIFTFDKQLITSFPF